MFCNAQTPVRHSRTLRQAVQDMTVLSALEYVLAAYEELSGQDGPHLDESADFHLTPQQSAIFCLLRRRLGQLTLNAALLSVCDALRPDPVESHVMRSHISALRVKLAGRYTIKCASGRGYTMSAVPPA